MKNREKMKTTFITFDRDDIIKYGRIRRSFYAKPREALEMMIGTTENRAEDDRILLTTQDLVKAFDTTEKTISEWVKKENLPVYSNEPRKRRFDLTEILKWVYNKSALANCDFCMYEDRYDTNFDHEEYRYSGEGHLYYDDKTGKYYGSSYKVWNESKNLYDEHTDDTAEPDRRDHYVQW